jgi:hypothetical protein
LGVAAGTAAIVWAETGNRSDHQHPPTKPPVSPVF